ncbi:hypothetical protein C8J56DRAFT_817478 [Mycena floridula]|nr:hypothetical protein C8J56DRAFT_817478 [Mycena floridula]
MTSVLDPTPSYSSSSTLWATASKEWIIQPKPKPGRKPKKEPNSASTIQHDEEDPDTKGRRVQNRAAQRAFRERKQSQLAELQARVQSYEQGEIERNVALQNIAKRLKDENQSLRSENVILKERIAKLEQENERKRWRDDTPSSTVSNILPPTKKQRLNHSSPISVSMPVAYTPSPPSMASSPDSDGASDPPFSPIQLDHVPLDPSNPTLSNLIDFATGNKSGYEAPDLFSTFGCGFCTQDSHCVCRELALQQAADQMSGRNLKLEQYTQPSNSVITIESSILDNLPAFQPAVPLRRRPTGRNAVSVFRTIPLSSTKPANCSGDPSNCEACADDSFGQAFCAAINRTVSSQQPCTDCPCGDGLIASSAVNSAVDSTIPTNDAWQQLKSHPNVSFADLSLLADVVARRSKCTGPRISLSPGRESPDTDYTDTPEAQSVILTDPHAHYHEKARQRSSPVSQEIPVRCGQQRGAILQVQAAGVEEALRLLDERML